MPARVHGGDRGVYVSRIRIEVETRKGERRTVVPGTRKLLH
jgi:hypothetical protein